MIVDIIIGIALIASIIVGIVRGFVKEIAVIVGLILGFYIASQKYFMLEKFLFRSATPSTLQNAVCFIIIFIVVFFLVFLLGLLLQKAIQLIMLGWLDKILGGIFGFVKGLIIIWIILMLVTTIFPHTSNTISKSGLAIKIIELGTNFTKMPVRIKRNKKLLTYSVKSCILIQAQPQYTKSSC